MVKDDAINAGWVGFEFNGPTGLDTTNSAVSPQIRCERERERERRGVGVRQ